MAIMSEHEKYYGKLNDNMKEIVQTSVTLGIIIGFLCGLVAASLLHKYIVHPFGW